MIFNKIRTLPILILSFIFLQCTQESNESSVDKELRSEHTEIASGQENIANQENRKTIIFFGNSLSAGYGVESHESFPSLIQGRLDSAGYDYTVINAGVSGETTATGKNRLEWVLERHTVDVFVLELGANDGLRGLPPEQTRQNLEDMIDMVRQLHPRAEIILAGMMVPPSMGREYGDRYNAIYPAIASAKNVKLIPFLLENVGGVTEMNQDDRIHPNPAGNKIVAENVWEVLKDVIKK